MENFGAPSPSVCSTCQNPVDPDARYCANCGSRLGLGKGSLPPGPSLLPPPNDPSPAAHTAAADPLIGAIVADRYRIVSLLGRGGMGVVYKVEHAKIGKIMALKLLTGELARSKDTVRRFKREALMVSRLSHPNTVQVFDYGSAGGLTYLAMEYLSGRDLGGRLEEEGPLSFTALAPLLLQACASLAEAHAQGIVHRDLKPENLFLVRGGGGEEIVKVLDFGLAKLRESAELNEVTSSGMIVGTPYYMSPEQVRGEDVDARGDVYALGAVMYTCLTGVPAFEAPTPVAVLTMQLTTLPEPPHLRFPGLRIPRGVSDLVMRALAKEPGDRFPTIADFAAAIEAELRGTSLPGYALPESGVYRRAQHEDAATKDEVALYERQLRRKHRLVWVGILGGLVGLGWLGASLYADAQAPLPFAGREREPNQDPSISTVIPAGHTVVAGRLGERFKAGAGDRDFYALEIEGAPGEPRSTTLAFSGLPNIATRLSVFREGNERPLLQLATGTPGQPVRVDDLRVSPGKYTLLVEQDLDPLFPEEKRYVLENVSDDYTIEWRPASDVPPNFEREPNHELEFATPVESGATRSGLLNFLRDVDVVCVTELPSPHRFVVRDAVGGARPSHAVLQVTPLFGPNDKIPVRVHGETSAVKTTERDRKSPLEGPLLPTGQKACVRLELVPNPWAEQPHPELAPPSEHRWEVALVSDR